jgi:hypothetical protein
MFGRTRVYGVQVQVRVWREQRDTLAVTLPTSKGPLRPVAISRQPFVTLKCFDVNERTHTLFSLCETAASAHQCHTLISIASHLCTRLFM